MATTSGAISPLADAVAFGGTRRLVVLGFGAIGAGLFAYEAHRSGAYASPLVVDVQADLVAGLRAGGGRFRLNIARADGIDRTELGSVDVADPMNAADRERIVEAIAVADEIATALPSVELYDTPVAHSPHLLLAQGLVARSAARPLIVFCAENRRHAAALLEKAVMRAIRPAARDRVRERVRYADTVIGKMSGVVSDLAEVEALGLATITPALPSAFLVEEFDRILVSRIDPDGGADALHPGMPALREVDDLAPFEDAKLLGHNATHALAGFLGSLLSLTRVAELRHVPAAMAFLRAAFLEESGRALIARHAGADALFTPQGFATYADDLLARMVNPWLADSIERAARDPHRKLGWDDRLIGLIRLGRAHGIATPRYAMGVAAGLELLRRRGAVGSPAEILAGCWPTRVDERAARGVIAEVADGIELLAEWQAHGFAVVGGSPRLSGSSRLSGS